jgi:hypothetical protein
LFALEVAHPSVSSRYFVLEDGETRAYTFTRNEVRALTAERLLANFRTAGYIARTPKDRGALKPT